MRQPLIQRKNQSLPRNLANPSNQSLQSNIRSRKLIYSSQITNDHKSSTLTAPTHTHNLSATNGNINMSTIEGQYASNNISNINRLELKKNKVFVAAIDKFGLGMYQDALTLFEEVWKVYQGKSGVEKLCYYMGLASWYSGSVEKAAIYLSKALDEGY